MKSGETSDGERPTAESWEIREALVECWQEKEDSIMVAAGYKPVRGGLWRKGGVLFSRGAALQNAVQELRQKGESNPFNEA